MSNKHHVWKRTLKPGDDGHVLPELILVKGGKRAYLWVGHEYGCLGTLSGPATLRKLAQAILSELGEE